MGQSDETSGFGRIRDDAPRVAHLEGLRAGDGFIHATFLWRALAWFRRLGIP
jgi:hypothetical protein